MGVNKLKVRSKIALTYNTGLHTQASSIITGRIQNVAYGRNFELIAVQFTYQDANDEVISKSAWNIEGQQQIDDLFALIKPNLPPDAGECQNTLNKFYYGFLQVAADSWGTPVTDWEIVADI
jgi:hypothetical protein